MWYNIMVMKKLFEKIFITGVYLFCTVAVVELGVNYFSFKFLFPIKNATSYGYITRESGQAIIPLNKYSSRHKAQLALPFEMLRYKIISKKDLKLSFDEKNKKFGYLDSKGNVAIDYQFIEAHEFSQDYAIVAINKNNSIKFGTIDTNGNWIIEPKYSYLCPFTKYYTKACLDDKHCGVIDRFGNEIALMSYKTDKLNCKNGNCKVQLCLIGSKDNGSCNYFL